VCTQKGAEALVVKQISMAEHLGWQGRKVKFLWKTRRSLWAAGHPNPLETGP